MRRIRWVGVFAAGVVIVSIGSAGGQPSTRPTGKPVQSPPGKTIQKPADHGKGRTGDGAADKSVVVGRVAEILDTLEQAGGSEPSALKSNLDAAFKAARGQLADLFDAVVATTTTANAGAFVAPARALRLVTQLSDVEAPKRVALLKVMRERPGLQESLVFAVKDRDRARGAYKVLAALAAHDPAHLEEFRNLAAAICVVHDHPYFEHINENQPKSEDPAAIFDYFVKNADRMAYPIREMPPELLVWVVSCTGPIADLEWSLQRYGKGVDVGARFFEITYDHDYLRNGTAKKSDVAGWGLRTIAKVGGVCADQAYFAVTTARAQGIPAAYVYGRGGETSHAWVGYLKFDKSHAWWDFSSGRYAAYKVVRGTVIDPQDLQPLPDAFLDVASSFMTLSHDTRMQSLALVDAARRLRALTDGKGADGKGNASPPSMDGVTAVDGKAVPAVRGADTKGELELIEAALRLAPTNLAGWMEIQSLAKAGRLSYEDKVRWAGILQTLCGGKFPDFYVEILMPMMEKEGDVALRDRLYNDACKEFKGRPDLEAQIRLLQGDMWREAEDSHRAWISYEDVTRRFLNNGPFAVEAAERMAGLLANGGKSGMVVPHYKDLWTKIKKPEESRPEFFRQSNWFRLGLLYAVSLDEQNKDSDRDAVMKAIGVGSLPKKKVNRK